MVIFNECRIDKEGKNLIIDASIDSLSYYENVYLESLTIDTDKTFIEDGPSSNPIYRRNLSISSGSSLVPEVSTKPRNIRLKLTYRELSLNTLDNNILFVYIGVGGVPDPDTPCGMDNKYSVAVAVNMRPIYNKTMSYIKEFKETCTASKGFIDMILRFKAFELSLKTGNFTTAIKQWDKLLKNKGIVVLNRGCDCNGIYSGN